MMRFILAILIGLSGLTAAQSRNPAESKASSGSTVLPERKRALTITGSKEALSKVLENLTSRPHSWKAVPNKRYNEKVSVRLRWPEQPSYRELGAIIYLAQRNGLQISDTDLVEQ